MYITYVADTPLRTAEAEERAQCRRQRVQNCAAVWWSYQSLNPLREKRVQLFTFSSFPQASFCTSWPLEFSQTLSQGSWFYQLTTTHRRPSYLWAGSGTPPLTTDMDVLLSRQLRHYSSIAHTKPLQLKYCFPQDFPKWFRTSLKFCSPLQHWVPQFPYRVGQQYTPCC